jgi:hypothetical protein
VTDANGQLQFTATDGVSEVVSYSAVDVTDESLPVPGTATVDFAAFGTSCIPPALVAGPGFATCLSNRSPSIR